MLIYKQRSTITVTSGSGSDNTLKFSGAELVQIMSDATTSTNIYDLKLIDEDSDTVFEELAIEGSYEEHAIYMPLRGIYTIQISNATIDEDIIVKLLVEE